ncbi:activator-dependent family glycosyltransferase [Actinoplanes sp. NEAU-A12]|uniref:Activator-dependent family glycosyltransferase n=1 Tax=Actinoplanes sandaracinus TaxID=3045177 RepID=A0ABT6WZR6_9ACTN|nr:activator-dependent family glycosyltransferase [Actinoplanes sandaracinus]MDI6105169.1 activator-dependent family glycosyltransferase [Actinoplanes sandaracinus]
MRVLFTVIPEKTIFLTMVPLAWALRTAGHEVVVASQPSFADTITQAGLTAVPVGRSIDMWRISRLTPDLMEEARHGLSIPWDVAVDPANANWQYLTYGYDEAIREGLKPDNFPMIAGLAEFARAWQPDLVIWEPLSPAGAIAAKACGAAHARLLWSIDVFGATRAEYLRLRDERPAHDRADPLADWLGSYGSRYGYEYTEDMATGHFSIDQLPDTLRLDTDLHRLPMRYVPYGGPAVVPKWLWAKPERPRIALTMGTTASEFFAGNVLNLGDVLDSLADLDVEVVATVADAEREKLNPVPGNARVLPYVPLHALAPTCSVVISHAGPGTFLTTALHAVPQVSVPWDFDEPELARRAAVQGGSLAIPADQATGDSIRDAVQRLLAEPEFRRRAADLRDDLHALPAPAEVAGELVELAAAYRGS